MSMSRHTSTSTTISQFQYLDIRAPQRQYIDISILKYEHLNDSLDMLAFCISRYCLGTRCGSSLLKRRLKLLKIPRVAEYSLFWTAPLQKRPIFKEPANRSHPICEMRHQHTATHSLQLVSGGAYGDNGDMGWLRLAGSLKLLVSFIGLFCKRD